jgi:hypothetical protein
MIALQTRGAQLPDPSKATAQYANMMNMASQQRAAQLQGERTRQEMEYAKAAEGRAVAGEGRAAEKFSVEQSKALVSALGTGIVKILRDPSDASIGQVGQTFAAVGLEPAQFGPLLKQIQDIPDANNRKLFVMDLVTQSPEAAATLKAVMPEVKESKVGDATVFYDANANSANFGQEIFRFTAPAEPIKMTQNVVDGAVINTNPLTGVSAESIVGDPRANLTAPVRNPTYSSTGVRSPYAVGGGTGQQPMTPPVTPTPPAAVGAPPSMGAPGAGGDTFSKMIRQESRGKQFDRNGRPLTSSAGAIGIAQVMPKTAPEAAKLAGLPFDDNRYRNDPEYNLALGKAYYEKQLADFGNEQLAAAAYNAGPGAVRSALKKGGPNGWVNHVPAETRDYLKVVFGGGAPARTPTRPSGGAPTGGTGTPTVKPQTLSEQTRQKGFQKTLELFDYDAKTGKDSISPLISASTSGGAERIGSDVVGFVTGKATPGRVALGQLATLKDSMTFEKLRGKLGAQISDADVRLVANTMGDIANVDIPANERLAKWQNIVLPILVRGAGLTPVKRATPTGGGGTGGGAKTVAIPKAAIEMLRKNPGPKEGAMFDSVFGKGAAAKVLGQR